MALCLALFVVNGVLLGWVQAYEVLIGITSPAKAEPAWCAWPLSIVGWAAIPAFVGGTAGYLITSQIQTHQSRTMDDVLEELRQLSQPIAPQTGPPPAIPAPPSAPRPHLPTGPVPGSGP
ncbi:DUF6313 family protein [Streptomyces erythrochromogenes]|uniref:DUF6313 family protein n=1 Tax=Streptomyces erythrochromogenes TaxID=285574 RepID=UPI0037D242DD